MDQVAACQLAQQTTQFSTLLTNITQLPISGKFFEFCLRLGKLQVNVNLIVILVVILHEILLSDDVVIS